MQREIHPIDCACASCRPLERHELSSAAEFRLAWGGSLLVGIILLALTAHWLLPVLGAVRDFLFY